MKYTLKKVSLIVGCCLLLSNTLQAQNRIAYIDLDQVIQTMPQYEQAQKQLLGYRQTFVDEVATMFKEYENKKNEFDSKSGSFNEATRIKKSNELKDLERRIQDFQNEAAQKVNKKQQDLYEPLFKKASETAATMAKERGYQYAINASKHDLLLAPPEANLLEPVKKRLGCKP